MFDALYPEAADTALTAKLNRKPEPQPTQRFSAWGLFTAAPKGVAAGAAQGAGSTADILGAFGSVLGATGGSAGGMFSLPSDAERKQSLEAMDKLLATGPDYISEGGRSFRNVAKDYTPDPVTSHVSESAVFNLFRMGSKAITAAATLGNIPGAVVAGAEEGFTISDDLAQQGVDLATRTKVGAVNAVVNAAGFALPAAGKTLMQTGALALAGGPASFVAQNAATREILQAADYSKLADQYDPFDPVGLALSTVLPLGFGALAMRGAKVKGKTPDAPTMHPPEEVVDAARVSLIRQHMDSTNPVPNDIGKADAHVKAYTTAMDQQAAGERVSVDLPKDVALRASLEMDAKLRESGAQANTVPDVATFMADSGMVLPNVPAASVAAAKGNAFVTWLKNAGGVAWSQKFDIVGERGVRGNYAGIFTKKGRNLDVLVESAVQAGYLSRADAESANDVGGTRAMAELIRRATTGEKVPTVESAQAAKLADVQARADMNAADQMERELQSLGVDTAAARGNPEVLSSYLAEHRTALVNRKLSDIEAETKAERMATGEAYNLTPKQIDAQSRIALAAELDGNATHDAAMNAHDQTDFLNRIEEIINNAPRNRKTVQGSAGSAQDGGVSPRDGQATASSAIPRDANLSPADQALKQQYDSGAIPESVFRATQGDANPGTGSVLRSNDGGINQRPGDGAGFNPSALAAEANQLLSDGRSPGEVIGQLQAAGGKVSPELQNMLIGASEFGGRINDLVDQVTALKAQRGPNTQPFDLIAQAVENLRNGTKVDAPKPANPLDARLADIEVRNPTALDAEIPIEFDSNGKPTSTMTAREYLDMVKKEASQDAADANLIEVAANCFLSGGI
jgi:hypothetical protein